jgi:ribosomal-protein-alanine N-acetyltransferase
MNIKLRLLEESHSDKLYKFEVENRDFFEKILPSRGNEYYDINNFRKIQKELVEEQKDEYLMSLRTLLGE